MRCRFARRRRTADEVARLLREADRDLAKGLTVSDICRKIGIAEMTYYGNSSMTLSRSTRSAGVGSWRSEGFAGFGPVSIFGKRWRIASIW